MQTFSRLYGTSFISSCVPSDESLGYFHRVPDGTKKCPDISMGDNFEVIGRIIEVGTIAVNHSIRDLEYLNSKYGDGRWLKLKDVATVKFEDGTMAVAEVHWYQAHSIGKRQMKIKEVLGYESLEDYVKR